MLPIVDFHTIKITRLVIGGNPFSGFSHQGRDRDEEMLDYYTVDRIKETLSRAEKASINTAVMRSDNHVHRMLREYYNEGGTIQWIAQVGADSGVETMAGAIDAAVAAGAKAVYIHGAQVDSAHQERAAELVVAWMEHIRTHGIPAGVAGHDPEAHLWVDGLNAADFHAICFYNCGSVHRGAGSHFDPADPPRAVEVIRSIKKPCIGYKILGAGRVSARKGFEFAFANIKESDVVNVGMHRGDNDDMVEENAALVEEILNRRAPG